MSQSANHFKIGLFVIGALTLVLFLVAILGAGVLFRKKILVETYLDESVQGLDVGSDVRYRGVKIGSVDRIGFVYNLYQEASFDEMESRLVVVRFVVYPDLLGGSGEYAGAMLHREVQRGLRARLVSQGVTGSLYLEIDYLDPEEFPTPEYEWRPEHGVYFVPSAPSIITRVSEAVQGILNNLEELDLDGLLVDLRGTLTSLEEQFDDADLGGLSSEGQLLLRELRESNQSLQAVLTDPRMDALLSESLVVTQDFREAAGSVRETSDLLGELLDDTQLERGIAAAGRTAEKLEGVVDEGAGLVQNADRLMAEDLAPALRGLERTLARIERLVESQEARVNAMLEDLSRMARNAEDITESGKQYPSRFLWGGPPPELEYGQ